MQVSHLLPRVAAAESRDSWNGAQWRARNHVSNWRWCKWRWHDTG